MFSKSLRQKSERVLGIFQKTLADLSRIDLEAEEKLTKVEQDLDALQKEKQDIISLREENDRVMVNINKILS